MDIPPKDLFPYCATAVVMYSKFNPFVLLNVATNGKSLKIAKTEAKKAHSFTKLLKANY